MSVSARPPGRPRSESAHRAILDAVRGLMADVGYAGTTMDQVANRAGVSKQTIYRWWRTKADLALEASADDPTRSISVPDHGSFAADLRAFVSDAFRTAEEAQVAELLRGLLVEAQLRPDFGERFRTEFLEPRRAAFGVIASRADARGDLPSHPSPSSAADIVFGVLWYHLLATRESFTPDLVDDLVRALTAAP